MAFVTVGENKLFFETCRPNARGRTLLLVHGAGGSHLDWPIELRRLEETAVASLDLPGHGRSTPPGHQTIEGYADVVQAFIETTGLENVVVVGHSMGGAIAQALALRGLTQLSGLILIGTGARLPVSPAILEGVGNEDGAAFAVAVSLINRYAWRKKSDPTHRKKSYATMLTTGSETLHGDFFACSQFNSHAQLHNVQLPTLIISATEDKMVPVKFGKQLVEQIPNAQFEIVEDSGHYIQLEQPRVVSSLITNFLNNLV